MRRCTICDKPYIRGTMIDIGVGFMQVSDDTPACDCEYYEYMRENEDEDE